MTENDEWIRVSFAFAAMCATISAVFSVAKGEPEAARVFSWLVGASLAGLAAHAVYNRRSVA